MPTKKPATGGTDDTVDDVADDTPEPRSGVDRRLATVTRKRREAEEALRAAEEQIDALQGQIAEFKRAAKGFESVQAERDALVAERDGWAEEKAMIGIGLTDPEGIDLARLAYGRIKPEDRPKGGIAAWLGEREALPRGVAAYLPEPNTKTDSAKGSDTGASAKPPAKPAASADGKARHAPTTPQTFAPGSVSAMSADEVSASRDAIWAALGRKPPATPAGLGTAKKT